MARSSRGRRPCTIAIQFPATRTTARWPSSRTNVACWDNSMRVEGNSRPVRICCQSSGRLAAAGVASPGAARAGSWAPPGAAPELTPGAAAGVVPEPGLADAAAWAWVGGLAWGFVVALGGALRSGAGAATAVPGPAAALATVGWANRPNTSTSSHRRGWTLWRSCCSLPLSWLCHCSSLAVPSCWASSGSWGRNWGEKLVSSSRSGATAARTRSRSRLVRPCNTADGSRPRSSSSRQASTTPRGS